jgi:UDP-glucose 4-epimerase
MDNKPKILVTGGMGYIGSHTTVELIQQGFEVIIVDNLSNSNKSVLDGIEKITGIRPSFEQFDLCDKKEIQSCFAYNKNIQAVIHFAASKAVGESVQNPLKYYYNNLLSLINLLEVMIEFQVSNIVFSSSCTVYGQPDKLPVTEQSEIQKAESPYGNTKQICEEILDDTIQANANLKGIALRYFNPIGAHDLALIGELPLGVPSNLMPFITQTAMGIREKLNVFGNDYDTSDGSCVRDYIHVVDLAKAHVIATQRLLQNKNKQNFEYFNLGTGKGSTVLEVIHSFERVTGIQLNYEIVARRKGDVVQIYADTQLANKELGWKAEKNLDDMTLSAWNWEKSYRNK